MKAHDTLLIAGLALAWIGAGFAVAFGVMLSVIAVVSYVQWKAKGGAE